MTRHTRFSAGKRGHEAQAARQEAAQQAQRIIADARSEAQRQASEEAARILAAAQAETALERDRILAQARAEAAQISQEARAAVPAGPAAPCSGAGAGAGAGWRSVVAVFFRAELAAATDGFSEDHWVGGGGFGGVYQIARLQGLGAQSSHLAVKKLDPMSMQGLGEFLQKVQLLGACSHENLIRLLGFAADKGAHQGDDGVCLVTPLMKGGSLEDRLMLDEPARRRLALMPDAPRDGFPPLTWQQLLGVALGAVRGLEYLHTPDPAVYKPAILHRDIKPSNVLLDRDCNARLSDMGLAREQRPDAAHVTTMTTIAGTNGYIDDNYLASGRYDEAADGFAMGVTLLVILTGRRATDPPWAYHRSVRSGRCVGGGRDRRCARGVAARGVGGSAQRCHGAREAQQGSADHSRCCTATS